MWGGAQWTLLTLWVWMTVAPPILRLGLLSAYPSITDAIDRDGKRFKAWPEFWRDWWAQVILRCGMALLLYWGGFWN